MERKDDGTTFPGGGTATFSGGTAITGAGTANKGGRTAFRLNLVTLNETFYDFAMLMNVNL